MKIILKNLVLVLPWGVVLCVAAFAQTDYQFDSNARTIDESLSSPASRKRIDRGDADKSEADLRNQLDLAASNIRSRVGMSSCLEVSDEGDDSIEEAYRSGWMIEATLEEVEAALSAAAETPEVDDDIAAARLAHRGTYRYFLKK
jgi:hypothetical protein